MNYYFYAHGHPLPPGYYVYSSTFPQTMASLSPSYSVKTEPVFLDHLLLHMGKDISVATTTGVLEGKLTGVAIDHLQLTIDGVNYHIRFEQVVYFK